MRPGSGAQQADPDIAHGEAGQRHRDAGPAEFAEADGDAAGGGLFHHDDPGKAAEDDDRKGYDPTGTTENEDTAFLEMAFEMLLGELNKQDPMYGRIISLLAQGYNKGEILDKVDLGKEKTQAYAYVKKAQMIAKKIWYRDR